MHAGRPPSPNHQTQGSIKSAEVSAVSAWAVSQVESQHETSHPTPSFTQHGTLTSSSADNIELTAFHLLASFLVLAGLPFQNPSRKCTGDFLKDSYSERTQYMAITVGTLPRSGMHSTTDHQLYVEETSNWPLLQLFLPMKRARCGKFWGLGLELGAFFKGSEDLQPSRLTAGKGR